MPLMVRQRATTPALVRFLSRMMMTEVPARRGVAAAALEQLFIGDLTGATRALFMFGDPLSRAFLFEPLVDYIARRMPFIPDEWHHFLAKLMTKCVRACVRACARARTPSRSRGLTTRRDGAGSAMCSQRSL
jgi:hypothetical protein